VAAVSSLDRPELEAAFARSNLPAERWSSAAGWVDDMCSEQGISPGGLGAYTEFSEVEAYRFPDGEPGITDTHLMAVLDVGLVMMREVGTFRKRTDSQFMMFDEFQGGEFVPDESVGGRGWGYVCIQAVRGSVPVFRVGWYFDSRSSDQRNELNSAANERDRILQAIRRWV
jgi:hypothetical protein